MPVIADMLALRQVIGLPGSTIAHYFCTFCDLDFDDIEVFDRTEWPTKNSDHIRFFAKLWKEASCERYQQAIFEATGLRWSALFDLPYWDPALYTIINQKLLYKLLDFKRKVLYTVCVQHDVKSLGHTRVVGTRWVLGKNICHWVCLLEFWVNSNL